MKKLNDVSIRIKILVPITFMVLIMFSYLGGSMNGFRLMNNNAEILKEQGMEKTRCLDEVNLQAQIMMKLSLAYCVNDDSTSRERIWNEVAASGSTMSENLARAKELIITDEGQAALVNLTEKVNLLGNSLAELKNMADTNNMQSAILYVNTTLTEQSNQFDEAVEKLQEINTNTLTGILGKQDRTY